uniref:Putative secreted protein n=1 Tax=Ixodes ricinus TaxID=34613 RepID=A0A147BS88_IXORI
MSFHCSALLSVSCASLRTLSLAAAPSTWVTARRTSSRELPTSFPATSRFEWTRLWRMQTPRCWRASSLWAARPPKISTQSLTSTTFWHATSLTDVSMARAPAAAWLVS